MKKYLYDVYEGTKEDAVCIHVPAMPKVLANKTAKRYAKAYSGRHYFIAKSTLVTKDGSPHGVSDWHSYIAKATI